MASCIPILTLICHASEPASRLGTESFLPWPSTRCAYRRRCALKSLFAPSRLTLAGDQSEIHMAQTAGPKAIDRLPARQS